MHTDDDDPWQDDTSSAPGAQKARADADWNRLQSSFTTAGYREGITAGKEGALQEGFDAGFAQVGAPLGRALGALRGRAAAVLAILAASAPSRADLLASAREIAAGLSDVRFSDIAPPDVEAERHAREHLASADAPAENEENAHRRDMEGLEDTGRPVCGR